MACWQADFDQFVCWTTAQARLAVAAAMLAVIAAALTVWFCWPCIKWLIGTVACWLGSWYACVAERLPMLR